MNAWKLLRLSAAMLALALPLGAHAGDEWAHKRKLSFDTTAATGADIKEAVAQLPVLVRLHSGNFTFSEAKPDGSDLRFLAADGKTPLKHHVESYDATNELATVWVQMPKLSADSKTDSLVMQWGNEKATPSNDAKGSYDAAQVFVFHFSNKEKLEDSTGKMPDAVGADTQRIEAGPIGGSLLFNGSSKLTIAAAPALKLQGTPGFTLSLWFKPQGSETGNLYVQRDGANAVIIGLSDGTLTATSGNTKVSAKSKLQVGVMQHVAVTATAGKITFYVDGMDVGSSAFAFTDLAGEATVGEGLHGELDEMALASGARSSAYIRSLAQSQMPDSPMVGFAEGAGGAEEGISYFAILLGAVTVDGWVVIGILMVMAVISVWVMVSKTVVLSKISKANSVFMERFAQSSAQLLTPGSTSGAALAKESLVKDSTIYHLYAKGMHEIADRFHAQTQLGKIHALSAASLDAIRASLDAAMVRENQRLNSGIVLLTIAISGGPFLGLLGTVVGVMITFAAIAAAGDVNVNAIAPGIAAALVATVAGLAVAIPALFGYNWLAIRIKNVSADNQVFADEFLTRSAELHSQ